MPDPLAIEAIDLRKRYGPFEALCGLSLQVPTGSIYGFLGKNGAGKTTTIKVLLGMAPPSGGVVRVLGEPATEAGASVAIRQRTGFVSEDKDLYGFMTVEQIIRFTAAFYPRWRRDLEARYLSAFALPPAQKVKALSRGTRTRLALLLALCRDADLLVLDEPTSGLDPAAAEGVLRALVGQAAAEGTTIFFSSHQIAEVEQIADHVAIVDAGRTLVAGALDDLRARYRRVELVFDGAAPDRAWRAPGVERVHRDGRVVTLLCSAGADPVLEEAHALGPRTVDVTSVPLKDIFLETVASED